MDPASLLRFTVVGIVTGSIYAVGASGLVLTYTTTGVFNFAHGAIGMVAAYGYWQARVGWGLPGPVAIAFALLVLAPLLGLATELLMRRFRNADVTSQLVITIGLLVTMIGAVQKIFPPEVRSIPALFSESGPRIGGVVVSWDQLATLALAIVVAVGLRLLLFRSRIGITMRAVVDNPTLAGLNGARPVAVARLSWVLGAMLGALAGILIGPAVGLEAITLTFLVVNAYAAAMAGRLRSLPLTFVGALGLGLIQSYYDLAVLELGLSGIFQRIKPAIPTMFLFAFLLLLPADRLRSGRAMGMRLPALPTRSRVVATAAAAMGLALVIAPIFPSRYLPDLTRGVVNGIIMLSVVALTGYAGLLSLSPLVFAGLGAWTMAVLAPGGSPLGLLAAALVAAPVGAIVALPALRLKGLYLALSTFAFAVLATALVFQDPHVFGTGNRDVARPAIGPLDASGDQAFFVVCVAVFVLLGLGLVALRRSPVGRRLAAMRDAEAACATLGLDVRRQKVAIFALSAAIAGIGGALLGGQKTTFGGIDVEVFNNLPLLLLIVIGGITTVTGALVGGLLLATLPLVQSEFSQLGGVLFAVIGATAVALGRQPNGLVGLVSERLDTARGKFRSGWRNADLQESVDGLVGARGRT